MDKKTARTYIRLSVTERDRFLAVLRKRNRGESQSTVLRDLLFTFLETEEQKPEK